MKRSMVFEGIVTILALVLLFLLFVMVTAGSPKDYEWEVTGSGPVLNIHLGQDGTLYAFTGAAGNTIYAIDDNGTVRWKYQVPGQWSVTNVLGHGVPSASISESPNEPAFATDNGTLYLYIRERDGSSPEERLIAIGDGGKDLWAVTLDNSSEPNSDVRLSARNGNVYAYTDYKVTVLNESGSVLFTVDRVSDPPAVDEGGNLYISLSCREDVGRDKWRYQEPLGTIVSYNSVGSIEWAKTIDGAIARPDIADSLRPLYGSLPMYRDGLLYVPVRNGIEVLYANGSVKWSREFGTEGLTLFPLLPFDERGNVYLSRYGNPGASLTILSPDGRVLADGEPVDFDWLFAANGDPYRGRIYYYGGIEYHGSPALDNLITYDVAAYGLLEDRKLWDYDIPTEKKSRIVVNKNNIRTLGLDGYGKDSYILMHDNSSRGDGIGSRQSLMVLPAKDHVYLSFYTVNYQSPVVPGHSGCVYSSAIYALDGDGALVWSKSTDSFASAMAVNNSTIYYGTQGGEVVSARVGSVVGGIALIALAYVFIRFFLVGAVARARARLNKNENRNCVFDFIAGHPGSTAREISRGTGVNLGTVRYHMFILGLNQRLTASRADGKYVRYFTNSNSYTKDEQLVLSLMRRDALGKVLSLVLKKPGISNAEIAGELDMRESVVCRCVKELSEKGLIARDPAKARGAYSIPDAYREPVADAVRRFHGQ